MSDAITSSLMDRFRAMPRAMRWGSVAGVFIVLFLAADSTIWAMARDWTDQGNTIQALLDEAKAKKASVDRELRTAIVNRGAVRIPGSEAEGSEALAEAVNEIMNSHGGVTNFSYDSRGGSRLPTTALKGIARPGQRASRATGEIQFDAPPDVATAIIAAVESDPDIEAVSRLSVVRHENVRRVTVRMTVEAWVLTQRDSRRG